MSTISLTKLYDLLTSRLGKETAGNLTSYIEDKIKDEFDNKSQVLVTKEDLALTKDDLTRNLNRLDLKISETKVDLIKWIFAFWLTLALMIVGLYLKK